MSARVDAYLAKLPPVARRELKRVRSAIRTAARGAEEHFSYGIPGFRLDGKPLVWYAAWKAHLSLYPIGASLIAPEARAMVNASSSKGTVRFPLDAPPSAALVKRLIKARMVQVRAGKAVG